MIDTLLEGSEESGRYAVRSNVQKGRGCVGELSTAQELNCSMPMLTGVHMIELNTDRLKCVFERRYPTNE